MGHTTTVPSHIRPDNEEISERILMLVRSSLNGDEVILRVVMDGDPVVTEWGEWEARYVVAWQSESRKLGQDCGTHLAMLNSQGTQELIRGHYLLPNDTALADCAQRASLSH